MINRVVKRITAATDEQRRQGWAEKAQEVFAPEPFSSWTAFRRPRPSAGNSNR